MVAVAFLLCGPGPMQARSVADIGSTFATRGLLSRSYPASACEIASATHQVIDGGYCNDPGYSIPACCTGTDSSATCYAFNDESSVSCTKGPDADVLSACCSP